MPSSFISDAQEYMDKPALDNAKPKYLKYRCTDISQTIDFYMSMGMTLEFQIETESSILLSLAFKSSSAEFNDASCSLLFEYNKKAEVKSAPKDVFNMPTRPVYGHQYLVIYVHFINRVIKRLETRGYLPIHDIKTNYEVSLATFYDPNHVEIRLVECSNSQNNESNAGSSGKSYTSWYARVGYCVISCPNLGQMATFYERTFSSPKMVGKRYEKNMHSSSTIYEINYRKIESRDAYTQRLGFHVIDAEALITGTSYSNYLWLGMELREKGTSFCLCERNADNGNKKFHAATFQDPTFIGIAFNVPILDSAVSTLKNSNSISYKFQEGYGILPELGYFTKFDDIMNYTIDLFSSVGQLSTISAMDRKDKDKDGDSNNASELKKDNVKMTYEQRLDHVERLAKQEEQNISEFLEEKKAKMSRSTVSESDLTEKLKSQGTQQKKLPGQWFSVDEMTLQKADSEFDVNAKSRRLSF